MFGTNSINILIAKSFIHIYHYNSYYISSNLGTNNILSLPSLLCTLTEKNVTIPELVKETQTIINTNNDNATTQQS